MKNLSTIKHSIKNDNYILVYNTVKAITNRIDKSFWFQNKFINNICLNFMLLIWKVFNIKNPIDLYCEMLVWPLLLCEDRKILFSKELNKLIHGPWIYHGYSCLQEIPANIDAFHAYMSKVNKIKIGYPYEYPLKLKNNQKWNTIISKTGYFYYEKIK